MSNSKKGGEENANKKVVIIVGGGPAGASTAKAMSDRGYDVTLMEAYDHPLKIDKNSPKAYSISLRERGYKALENVIFNNASSSSSSSQHSPDESAAKLQTVLPNSVITHNMIRHTIKNKEKGALGEGRKSNAGLLIPRKYLSSGLLNLASKAGVEIHYNTKCIDIDTKNHIVKFITKSDKGDDDTIEFSYDLLIGTDGSNSTVREILDKKCNDFSIIRKERDTMEYQVVTIPPSMGGSPSSLFPGSPETAVHTWNDPKHNSISLAFPLPPGNNNNSISTDNGEDDNNNNNDGGGIILPIVFPEGKLNEYKTNDTYDEPIRTLFPDLSDEIRNNIIINQLKSAPIGNGGWCIWCTSMGSLNANAVLIGDSAHGMWPSLGQGANCALESVSVFINTLDAIDNNSNNNNNNWSNNIINEYNNKRYDDVIAAVDLTYGGIGARKARGRQNAPILYKVQIIIMMLLHVLSCKMVPKPALLRLMGGEIVPYTSIRKYHFYYEKVVTLGILLGTTCSIVAYFL